MMERKDAKKIIDRELVPLMERLGIPHWKVVITLGPIEQRPECSNIIGWCVRYPDYNQAEITINFDDIEDETMLMRTLVHELFHIVISPFDVYRDTITQHIEPDSHEGRSECRLFTYVVEQTIINLERMYRGLSSPVAVSKSVKGKK